MIVVRGVMNGCGTIQRSILVANPHLRSLTFGSMRLDDGAAYCKAGSRRVAAIPT